MAGVTAFYDAKVLYPAELRNLLMHGFHLIVATLCVRNVRDTQCGFKLFDRTAARVVFTPMHIERWAFDVELLFVAARRNLVVKVGWSAWSSASRRPVLTCALRLRAGSGRAVDRSARVQARRRVGDAHDAARARAHPRVLLAGRLERARRRLPPPEEAPRVSKQKGPRLCF